MATKCPASCHHEHELVEGLFCPCIRVGGLEGHGDELEESLHQCKHDSLWKDDEDSKGFSFRKKGD